MRKLVIISFVLMAIAGSSCKTKTNQIQVPVASINGDVAVYYFHMTTRCATCITIESEARKNVEMLYSDLVKAGKISFTALNLEEATGISMGEKLGVNSQTLLIVKGDQKINITNEGFLYAVSQPQKFSDIMKSKIDPLVK
jgi:hypothetical protein